MDDNGAIVDDEGRVVLAPVAVHGASIESDYCIRLNNNNNLKATECKIEGDTALLSTMLVTAATLSIH